MISTEQYGIDFLSHMPTKDKSCVDVGCGTGWAALRLKEKGIRSIIAVDIMDRTNFVLEPLLAAGIEYLNSVDGLKSWDADYIWCHHMLEHIQDPIEFLTQLRPIGKQLWISVPPASLKGFAKGHIHQYTLPLLIEHLRRGGWDIENGSYTTSPGPAVGSILAVVDRFEDFEFDKTEANLGVPQKTSRYPKPMDVLNSRKENHFRAVLNSWNWRF